MSHSVDKRHQPGSAKSYLIGFVLSRDPYRGGAVLDGDGRVLPPPTVLATVVGMAVVRFFVHLVYFLHINTLSEERWNLVALIFTVLIIAIVVVGSLWIMYNLNINMMVH
ncbi:cytochrome o ubiquinol oxidase subunit IV [Escherichia coli]